MSKLEWTLLIKKRGSSTQDIPLGKQELAWVTNTVTLIYGRRDAVLVDTFLTGQQSRELVDWVIEKQSWLDMACSIPIAPHVILKKRDVISMTSTIAWQLHRRRWNFTRGCSHCIQTGLIQGRSGRRQKQRNRPRV